MDKITEKKVKIKMDKITEKKVKKLNEAYKLLQTKLVKDKKAGKYKDKETYQKDHEKSYRDYIVDKWHITKLWKDHLVLVDYILNKCISEYTAIREKYRAKEITLNQYKTEVKNLFIKNVEWGRSIGGNTIYPEEIIEEWVQRLTAVMDKMDVIGKEITRQTMRELCFSQLAVAEEFKEDLKTKLIGDIDKPSIV